jgi:hypothetical protein
MRPCCGHKHPRWLCGVGMIIANHQLHIWRHTGPYWSYRLSAQQATFMMKNMKRAHEHTYRPQRPGGGSAGWGSSRAIDSRIERGVGISTSEVSAHIYATYSRNYHRQVRSSRSCIMLTVFQEQFEFRWACAHAAFTAMPVQVGQCKRGVDVLRSLLCP